MLTMLLVPLMEENEERADRADGDVEREESRDDRMAGDRDRELYGVAGGEG